MSSTRTSSAFDFDPQPGTSFRDAVTVVRAAREVLGELGMTGFVKTSGGRGVHLSVRIVPEWDFIQVRRAVIALGRELERRLPALVTTSWWKEERGERIFIDYNQAARDRTIVAAYSARAVREATVSAPVTWEELDQVEPGDFTVASMLARHAAGPIRTPGSTGPTRRRFVSTGCSRCPPPTSGTAISATCRTLPTTRKCRASRPGSSPPARTR